jgi:hypothetical protein
MKYLRSNNYKKQVNFTTTIFRQISSTERLLLLQLRLSRFFQVPTIVGLLFEPNPKGILKLIYNHCSYLIDEVFLTDLSNQYHKFECFSYNSSAILKELCRRNLKSGLSFSSCNIKINCSC